MERDTIQKDMTLLKALSIIFGIVAMIVGVTVYVASKPSREDVRQMIDDKVVYRLESIDKRLENIEKKLQ